MKSLELSVIRRRCMFCLKTVAPLDSRYYIPQWTPDDSTVYYHLWVQPSLVTESLCYRFKVFHIETYPSQEPLVASM
jgi:hypothetical protein